MLDKPGGGHYNISVAMRQYEPLAQPAEHLTFNQRARGSNPRWFTIKSKRYRCHWRKASGINRFRAFSAQKSIDSPIDANRCSPLTGGTRTPIFQRLAKTKPCGALFEAIIFKKGAVFHIQIFYEIEGAVLLVLMTIKAAPFLFFQKSKRAPAQGGK